MKNLFFLLLIIVLFQCNTTTSKQKSVEQVVENTLGKKLLIPNNLVVYKPFEKYLDDSIGISQKPFKIYSLVDATCSVCVDNIVKWDRFVAELNNRENVSIILILESDDNFELIKYICEEGIITEFSYPFFFDINNEFIRLNPFIKKNKHLETILTDTNNNIIMLGNPLFNENIKNKFREIVTSIN